MSSNELIMSEKDKKFRDFSLNGNMWMLMLSVCMPLALHQSLTLVFKIVDSIMAAHVSATSVSTVAYLSQINLVLSSIGGGLATGASIKISEAYGAGNYDLVKSRVSSLFALCSLLGIAVLIGILPFTTQFLRLAGTPDDLISTGTTYFMIELVSMVVGFFNSIYISIERARGNSKRILNINMIAIVLKMFLTGYFVYILNKGITMIAVSTLISQIFILSIAIYYLCFKKDLFSFSIKKISFKKNVVNPMLNVSIPVIAEKVSFSLGKVIVNAMSTLYGSLTVGALSISTQIDGFTTYPQIGFQSGGMTIISQNKGAQNIKRALYAFRVLLVINICIGVIGYILSIAFLSPIVSLFAKDNVEFATLIKSIYHYDAIGLVPLGIYYSIMAFLYGFGYTKLSLIINLVRLFIFRIPSLWILQNFTTLGKESVGIAMMISHILTALLGIIIIIPIISKINKEEQLAEVA